MMISGPVFRRSTGPETRLPRLIQTAAPYTHPAGKHVVVQQPKHRKLLFTSTQICISSNLLLTPCPCIWRHPLDASGSSPVPERNRLWCAPPLRPGLRGVTRERRSLCLCPSRTVVPELDSHVFRVPSSGVVDEKAPRVKESREQRHAKLICM